MKNTIVAFMIAMFTLSIVIATVIEADAARFGRGKSFGGSPSFSKSYTAPKAPASTFNNQSSTAATKNAAGQTAGRGFGAMGGIFGGLLAGTLLGSLLSGGGFAGGGMLDILLIGGALFLLFRFLGRRKQSQQHGMTNNGMSAPIPQEDNNTYRTSAAQDNSWDSLNNSSQGHMEQATPVNVQNNAVPSDFDQENFLRGAKMAYQRLNDSWDKRDLADIASFTTSPFMQEINSQAQEDQSPSKTEIMLINAQLLSVTNEAGRETATVFFDVTLREEQNSPTIQVREAWHFVRASNSDDMWKLDGIQQVEDA